MIKKCISFFVVMSISFVFAGEFAGGDGSPADPYHVTTAEHLDNIRNYLDAHFIQMANIDLSDYAEGEGWDPIGVIYLDPEEEIVVEAAFTGSYDGNGYVISNLTINRNDIGVALLSCIDGAHLVNIGLENVQINGHSGVASLVGLNNGGSVSGCYAEGTISGIFAVGGLVGVNTAGSVLTDCYALTAVSGEMGVGGLVGMNEESEITGCYADTVIRGKWAAGGLAGVNEEESVISNSHSTGSVSGIFAVGGLAGVNEIESTIQQSYSASTVSGLFAVGGLAGLMNEGIVAQSYAAGPVSGLLGVGGLVGLVEDEGFIIESYAAGEVSGKMMVGGLVGGTEGDDEEVLIVERSYYDSESTGQANSEKGTPLPTSEMMQQNSFTAWDFGETWDIIEGVTYPYHRWIMTEDKYAARIDSYHIPSNLFVEHPGEMSITMRNTGTVTWETDSDFVLATVDNGDSLAVPENWQIELEHDVQPGQLHSFVIPVAPAETGVFKTTWQMHRQGNIEFGEICSQNVEVHPWYFAQGSGTPEDPYQVENAGQLYAVRYLKDGYFIQTADISLEEYSDGKGWVPIGAVSPFSGKYDGDGYSISGLFIDTETSFNGLFGYVEGGAELKNIHLESVSVTGRDFTGSLAAWNIGSIDNCHAWGSVSGDEEVGGLVALNVFEGTISHSSASVDVSGYDFVGGLVGVNDIDSVIIDSSAHGNVTGNENVGGLAGENIEADIITCYASGDVSGEYYVGGLVGLNEDGTIEKSFATGNVTGGHRAGGLAGENYVSGIIRDCYAWGSVTSDAGDVGGLVGLNEGEIFRCYAVGAVSGSWSTGGLAGANYGGVIEYSYYDQQTTGMTDTGKGMPLLTSEMRRQTFFIDWDFPDTWDIIEERTYPYLSWQDVLYALFEGTPLSGDAPLEVEFTDFSVGNIVQWHWNFGDGEESLERHPTYVYTEPGVYTVSLTVTDPDDNSDTMIKEAYIVVHFEDIQFAGGKGTVSEPYLVETAEQLNHVRYYLDTHFKQVANIDLSDYSEGDGWNPIGCDDYKFWGSYNGDDYVISGLTIDRPETDQVGLFGVIGEESEVMYVTLENIVVRGKEEVGGLVGWNDGGIIRRCCIVSGTVEGETSVGGLAGSSSYRGLIEDCCSSAQVEGDFGAGGLVGINQDESTVRGCYSAGSVTGKVATGGLAGLNNFGSTIKNSHSRSNVICASDPGEMAFAGGLVGINGVRVIDGEKIHIGPGIVENSYAIGLVTGENFVAGLIGTQGIEAEEDDGELVLEPYDLGTVSLSFWNSDIHETGIGYGDDEGAEGKTTAEMMEQSTFTEWDFDTVWKMSEPASVYEGYPVLRWQWFLTSEEYEALVHSYNVPALYKNRHDVIRLKMRNTGTQVWEAGTNIYLGAVGDYDDLAPSQYWRVALQHNVEPGQLHTFEIPVYPQESGIFTTEWQMLKEGVQWFGEIFSTEVEVAVRTHVEGMLWPLFE